MITDRVSHRSIVALWLAEIAKTSHAEKAPITESKIIEMSEPILHMVASENAAPADRMRKLLDLGNYEDKAFRYLAKNAMILVGIREGADEAAVTNHDRTCRQIAREILDHMTHHIGQVTSLEPQAIVDQTERVNLTLRESHVADVNNIYSGDASTILMREVLGLPGDYTAMMSLRDPEVAVNAGLALRRLGIDVSPEAFTSIGMRDPDEDGPQPG